MDGEQTFALDGGNNRHWFVKCAESDDFQINVYNDDVNTYEAAKRTLKMLAILNAHWNDPEFAALNPEPIPENLTEEESEAEYDRRYEEGKRLVPSR